MKTLLLSPYDAPSHAYWRTGLCRHLDDWQWTCLTLPARYFSWRVRGNSLTWSFDQRAVLAAPCDLVIATSMTDLATLRGLVPRLAQVPTILYFHENQFAYPASMHQRVGVEPQMVSLYAALAADCLLFNSHYNRTTFLAGVAALLKKLPDAVPLGVVERLAVKAQVLPVPLEHPKTSTALRSPGPLQVVWNHRWEYDKGPELLLAAIGELPADLSLQFHVIGQQFRRRPAEFDQIRQTLEQRGWLGLWGYIESTDEYRTLLREAHVVLSTAHHDFQGLAVLEAVAEGCLPLLPDRLVYPEWFAPHWLYASGAGETKSLCDRLCALAENRASSEGLDSLKAPDISALSWKQLESVYRTTLIKVAEAGAGGC